MKQLYSISAFGSIKILGVALGTDRSYLLNYLSDFDILNTSNAVSIHGYTIPEVGVKVNIVYFIKDNAVSEIQLQAIHNNQKEADALYGYYRKIFADLNLHDDNLINGATTRSSFTNTLHRIHFFKQKGLANDKPNEFPVFLFIRGVFETAKDVDEIKKMIRQIYLDKNTCNIQPKTKINRKIMYKMFRIICAILLLAILFLFALNGRYQPYADGYVIDKWTHKLIICEEDTNP